MLQKCAGLTHDTSLLQVKQNNLNVFVMSSSRVGESLVLSACLHKLHALSIRKFGANALVVAVEIVGYFLREINDRVLDIIIWDIKHRASCSWSWFYHLR